jgi:hypothetical protein
MSVFDRIDNFKFGMEGKLQSLNELFYIDDVDIATKPDLVESWANSVLRDCSKFLKTNVKLYRGMSNRYSGHKFGTEVVRRDRTPRDSSPAQNALMNLILKKHRLPSRQEALFTTTDSGVAAQYSDDGPVVRVFPVDDFSFHWFPSVEDFFDMLDNYSLLLNLVPNKDYKGLRNLQDFYDAIYERLDKIDEPDRRKWEEMFSSLYQRILDMKPETRKFPTSEDEHEVTIKTKEYYYCESAYIGNLLKRLDKHKHAHIIAKVEKILRD